MRKNSFRRKERSIARRDMYSYISTIFRLFRCWGKKYRTTDEKASASLTGIYQPRFLLQLIQIVRLNPPSQNAFESSFPSNVRLRHAVTCLR